MEEPHFVGCYHGHRIRIYKDDDEQPWRIVFDSICVDAKGKSRSLLELPEARERTQAAAQHTTLALAQNDYLCDLPFQKAIEWRKL